MLKRRLVLIIPFTVLLFHTTFQNGDMVTLSRGKRYIVFPEGSTFSVAFCTTWKTLTDDLDIYTIGLNWAISYELPNQTIRDTETHRIVPPFTLRRRRREFYLRLEAAMDAAGIEGRSCIKRALCETAQRLIPKASILEELLRILFSLPPEKVDMYEPVEHHEYDAAHRRGLSNRACPDLYPECSISLIDMILGA
ncbi:uncharacterized protein LOC110837223 [Zootermopsis nevadensis]|uniref:Uncharacterized protein n=1 Tax=Zootermopsis nevadensis TaxID=136037 RepID=A0A067RHY1_ZOONE|nr:uncharacterized protein LOC110837223 [Zootermopsis nevadensis]KDR23471.1 hypothetical protein L798_08673 [Zootermopsis nevadensis]